MKKSLVIIFALSTVSQALDPTEFTFGTDPSGYKLEWDGTTGVTSFIQYSTTLQQGDWLYFPVIKSGVGSYSFGFSTTENKMFVRTVSTDVPMDNAETYDLDGDGMGNLAELTASLQTDPLKWDTDGDGMNDGWEHDHNFDPTTAGTGDQDASSDPEGDLMQNLLESLIGSNPHVGFETLPNTDSQVFIPN